MRKINASNESQGETSPLEARPSVWFVILVAGLVFFLSLSKMFDFDYWTHLSLAKEFLASWSPLDLNEFFFGEWSKGRPFRLALYGVYWLGGHELVSLMVAGTFTLTFICLVYPPREEPMQSRLLRGLLVLLAVKVCLNRLLPRPELFGYLLFSVTLMILVFWLARPQRSKLWLIAALLTVWYPIHQTVYLGAPLLLAALVLLLPRERWQKLWPDRGRRWIPTIGVIAAVVLGGLCVRFALFVFRELGSEGILSGVSEMRPTWEFPEVLWQFLLLIFVTLFLCWRATALRWRLLLLMIPAIVLGLVVERNIALAALFLLFLGLRGLEHTPLPVSSFAWRRSLTVALLGVNFAAFAWLIDGQRNLWGVGLAAGAAPVEAARFVAEKNLPGLVFNNFDSGGYLRWAWGGEPEYFLDGNLGSREKVFDHGLLLEARQVEVLFAKYGVRTVLLQPCYWSSGRIFPLVPLLMFSPRWYLVNASDALVFVDQLPAGVVALSKEEGWQAILALLDHYQAINESATHLDFSRSVAWQGLGRFDEASAAFERGEKRFPELAELYRKKLGFRSR